ncbi:hypothetical protein [Marinomonas aquiplantarum]|uniref:Lipoprotein n=1 Tax=Marinomonas aquiplantarum TaxID=491951 RepID=A0A366D1X6_9GAMM|nr:hypothetical protein [Marinomonas aquiplantarum]RBO83925.1 hypothetical protein DFP76_103199 [Marinomonas aquiplantarum]
MKFKLLALLIAVGLTGCASTFTSIEPAAEDNMYFVTENHNRPFGVSGELHLCEAIDSSNMVCETIDD